MLNDALTVTFNVPARISKGLGTGELVRRGGVIQSTNGPVVAWLRESGPLSDSLAKNPLGKLPSNVENQITQLSGGLQMVAGLQILSLGVTVAGFYLLNKKLNAINTKLDFMLQKIDYAIKEIRWLDRRQDLQLFSKLLAALESADWAIKTARIEKLEDIRPVIVEAEMHYRLLVDEMLKEGRAYNIPEIFNAYVKQLFISCGAKSRCDIYLDGYQKSIKSIRESEAMAQMLRETYLHPIIKFKYDEHLPDLIRLDSQQREMIKTIRMEMDEAKSVMDGYAIEMSYCDAKGIKPQEWQKLGEDIKEEALILIEPKEEFIPEN